jgi:hypothetical protein
VEADQATEVATAVFTVVAFAVTQVGRMAQAHALAKAPPAATVVQTITQPAMPTTPETLRAIGDAAASGPARRKTSFKEKLDEGDFRAMMRAPEEPGDHLDGLPDLPTTPPDEVPPDEGDPLGRGEVVA